jgi:hypothetical protein
VLRIIVENSVFAACAPLLSLFNLLLFNAAYLLQCLLLAQFLCLRFLSLHLYSPLLALYSPLLLGLLLAFMLLRIFIVFLLIARFGMC